MDDVSTNPKVAALQKDCYELINRIDELIDKHDKDTANLKHVNEMFRMRVCDYDNISEEQAIQELTEHKASLTMFCKVGKLTTEYLYTNKEYPCL